MTTDATPHLFWITSRAAGTVALLAASVAVCLGLLMGSRLLKRFGGSDLRTVHEVLSLTTMVAIAVHGLSLIGDRYLHPSLLDVSVPFVSTYKSVWTSAGIISAWALIALGLSYYARGRIGLQRWRRLHRTPVPSAPGPPACRGPGRRRSRARSPCRARPREDVLRRGVRVGVPSLL